MLGFKKKSAPSPDYSKVPQGFTVQGVAPDGTIDATIPLMNHETGKVIGTETLIISPKGATSYTQSWLYPEKGAATGLPQSSAPAEASAKANHGLSLASQQAADNRHHNEPPTVITPAVPAAAPTSQPVTSVNVVASQTHHNTPQMASENGHNSPTTGVNHSSGAPQLVTEHGSGMDFASENSPAAQPKHDTAPAYTDAHDRTSNPLASFNAPSFATAQMKSEDQGSTAPAPDPLKDFNAPSYETAQAKSQDQASMAPAPDPLAQFNAPSFATAQAKSQDQVAVAPTPNPLAEFHPSSYEIAQAKSQDQGGFAPPTVATPAPQLDPGIQAGINAHNDSVTTAAATNNAYANAYSGQIDMAAINKSVADLTLPGLSKDSGVEAPFQAPTSDSAIGRHFRGGRDVPE
jgi:hypothetical protein